jgi:hypothetical protein
MSTRNLPGGVKGGLPARKADNFTTIRESVVQKMWDPRRLTTLWASAACNRDSFMVENNGNDVTLYVTIR